MDQIKAYYPIISGFSVPKNSYSNFLKFNSSTPKAHGYLDIIIFKETQKIKKCQNLKKNFDILWHLYSLLPFTPD